MAILRAGTSRHTLRARHLLGRSAACDLRLDDPAVSAEHAVVYWRDGGWWVRDLGSRNGTFLAQGRLEPGVPAPLRAGEALRLGDGPPLELVGAGPPIPSAVAEDGREVASVAGLLALPHEEAPELVVYRRADGPWVAEGPTTRRVADHDQVLAGGVRWELSLPEPLEETREVGDVPLLVPDVRMRFRVSRDEERVDLLVENDHRALQLEERAHFYPLLLLARARGADRRKPAPEQGWLARDELCTMLRMVRPVLNVQLFRARRHLAEAGVLNAGDLVERRARGTQLRISVRDVDEAALP